MDKIKNYEFLAMLEVEKKVALLSGSATVSNSIFTNEAVMELDKELENLSAAYISQNGLTVAESEMIYKINTQSHTSLLEKASTKE